MPSNWRHVSRREKRTLLGGTMLLSVVLVAESLLSTILNDPPTWSGAVLMSLGVAIAIPFMVYTLRLEKRVSRRKAGLCAACGYDLWETPDRCPECGRDARRT